MFYAGIRVAMIPPSSVWVPGYWDGTHYYIENIMYGNKNKNKNNDKILYTAVV